MKTNSLFLFFLLSLFIVSCDTGNNFDDLVKKEEQANEGNDGGGNGDEGNGDPVVRNDSIELTLTNYGKTVKFNMRKVESGSFSMGDKDNGPVHRVTLTRTYYMGETEVTQAQWETVMGSLPTGIAKYADDYPVYNMSWNNCASFVEKLNELTKNSRRDSMKFYIPTEAEWEFAARGGNKTKGYKYSGSDTYSEVAVIGANTSSSYDAIWIENVKQKKGNELDIFDMTGNVWEWCSDWHYYLYPSEAQIDPIGPDTGDYKVIRGGGTDTYPIRYTTYRGKASYRDYIPYNSSGDYGRIGLRILLK